MKKFLGIAISCALAASFAQAAVNPNDKILGPKVTELETYTTLDHAFAEKYVSATTDGWKSGCTAAAKVLSNGETVVGRNLDLYMSPQSAHVIRTAEPGFYKTLRLQYFQHNGQSFDDLKKNGLSDQNRKVLPFIATDVMNEKGLYMEINMRNNEVYPNGVDKFGCSGTNPGLKRVSAMMLPAYLAERCATVAEAIAMVRDLDIYTINDKNTKWPFCFMLADATGRYGVLELANNEAIWLEGQNVQTNFYINEKYNKFESYKSGIDRYDIAKKGLRHVQDERDMMSLLSNISYKQANTLRCNYDARSEFVGEKPYWTTEYVYDPANQTEVKAYMKEQAAAFAAKTRNQLEAKPRYWETAYTVVANCKKKTLKVRFFEDDKLTYSFGF